MIRIVIFLLLGIASGIYGIQQLRKDSRTQSNDKPE